MRRVVLVAGLAAAACGGSTSAAARADSGGACSPPSPGAWGILAKNYDTACTSDADCQAVYLGEDACEVAVVDGGQNMPCPNAAIAKSSYDTYLQKYEAVNAACRKECGAGSILCSSVAARCTAGQCGL